MTEIITLSIFTVALLICVAFDIAIIYPLIFGWILFVAYGVIKGHTIREMLVMSWNGVKTIKNILFVFMLIGVLTAVWRGAGTIPFIIFHTSKLISPQMFIVSSFLLCCLISVLTGTSFGTAATMGVICMMMGEAMGVNSFWLGGAILSGALFGDRCSPMSTSALLVSELTDTNIFDNIPRMIKTAVIPFILTCIIYFTAGLFRSSGGASSEIIGLFEENFNLIWITALPAALIIVLSLFRLNVKITMSVSIIVGLIICIAAQGMQPMVILKAMVLGYHTECAELSATVDGGGLVSMLSAAYIVCLSSCYSGIFEGTGMLNGAKSLVKKLADRTTPFGSAVVAAMFTGIISCNQTLAIMLSHQLCKDLYGDDNQKLAITIEDTAVVISPLVPWSIAGAVPIAMVSAPLGSLAFACYLYLLPIWSYLVSYLEKKRKFLNKNSRLHKNI